LSCAAPRRRWLKHDRRVTRKPPAIHCRKRFRGRAGETILEQRCHVKRALEELIRQVVIKSGVEPGSASKGT